MPLPTPDVLPLVEPSHNHLFFCQSHFQVPVRQVVLIARAYRTAFFLFTFCSVFFIFLAL